MSLDEKNQQQDPTMDIARKRAMAQLAMEGAERRKSRAEEERLQKEKDLIAQRLQSDKSRKSEEAMRIEAENLQKVRVLREERLGRKVEAERITEEIRNETETGLSPLRTLKYDMNRMIKSTKQSVVSMAIKEDEKRRISETGRIEEKKKSHLFIIMSAILITGGLTMLGWWGYSEYQKERLATVPNVAVRVDSIIFAENYNDIVVNDENAATLSQRLRTEVQTNNIPISSILYDRFLDNTGGTLRVITAAEWLTKLDMSAPDELVRLLGNEFMYGVYSGAQNGGFIVLKTSYYEKAFAGMLSWEGLLVRDAYPILGGKPASRELQNQRFIDVTIKNIDARVIKDTDGLTAMVYTFLPDKTTLVLAHNEATVLEILTRLATPKPQISK